MTLYLNKVFTCPVTTKEMSDALYKYRVGLINHRQYIQLTGKLPPEEEGCKPSESSA